MTELIIESGSCHMNKLSYMKEYVAECSLNDFHYLKFQLFPKEMTGPNIWLDPVLFEEVFHWGKSISDIKIFASVWDQASMDLLIHLKAPCIKFAYSQRNSPLISQALDEFEKVFVSYGFLDEIPDYPNLVPLFCEPVYPVVYNLDFRGIFSKFHSFSDHTIGIHQAQKALAFCPRYIEKHVTLPHKDISCPDARFSTSFNQLRFLNLL